MLQRDIALYNDMLNSNIYIQIITAFILYTCVYMCLVFNSPLSLLGAGKFIPYTTLAAFLLISMGLTDSGGCFKSSRMVDWRRLD